MPSSRSSTLVLSIASILILAMAGAPARADVVTDWNAIANTTVFTGGLNFPAIQGSRILAMTHAAIHDAVNAIDRRYKPYAMDRLAEPGASPEAAVAAAAHDVLVAQLPTQQATLDAAYAASLASIPEGAAKTRGVAIGQAAAAAILALRSADGSNAPIPYTPGTGPGVWQPTPPPLLPAALPGWGQVTPFALTGGAQFRPAVPKYFDLTSAEYTADYKEEKSIGDVNSTTRTAEQSEIAKFWYEGSQLIQGAKAGSWRETDAPQQVCKPRVGTQRGELWPDFEVNQVKCAFIGGFLQPGHGPIPISQAGINRGYFACRDVAALNALL